MKKSKLLFPFVVVSMSALLTGKWYYDDKLEAYGQAVEPMFQEAKEKRTLINSLDPFYHPAQPVIDFLHYKALTKSEVTIALFGSSTAAGTGASDPQHTWEKKLEKQIHSLGENFKQIRVHAHGFADYSTTELVKQAKVKKVIEEQPDLIVIETALFENFDQHIPIEQTNKDIEAIVKSFEANVPKAKLLLVSSPPISIVSEEKTKNYIGLTYSDYIQETTKFIEKNGWAYVNLHEKINRHLAENKQVGLSDVLTEGIYLNDEGQQLWLNELFDYLKK